MAGPALTAWLPGPTGSYPTVDVYNPLQAESAVRKCVTVRFLVSLVSILLFLLLPFPYSADQRVGEPQKLRARAIRTNEQTFPARQVVLPTGSGNTVPQT